MTAGEMIFRQQTLHNGVITIRQHGEYRVRPSPPSTVMGSGPKKFTYIEIGSSGAVLVLLSL